MENDSPILSGVLISSFRGICLSSSSQPVVKSTMSLSLVESTRASHGLVGFSRIDHFPIFEAIAQNTIHTSLGS